MPTGNITITPGRVLNNETITLDKLNDLGNPTARIDESAVTERELADGAFTGEKFADDAIGPEKLTASDLADGDYLLRVTGGVGAWQSYSDVVQFPVGAPFPWPGTSAPAGCALLEGQLLTRATYPILAELYAGWDGLEGDGTTTFRLPDMRNGYFIRGRKTGEDLGGTGGTEEETLTAEQMPEHSHEVRDGIGGDTTNALGNNIGFSGMNSENGYGSFDEIVQATGGGQAHNNLPPYINFNWAVRLG